MARAKAGNQVEAIGDRDARIERALRRGLDHRPVGDRVGEGDSDLDHVGAARDDRIEQARAGCEIRIAEHQERAERALAAPQPLEHRGIAAHASSALRLGDVLVAAAGQADEEDAVRLVPRQFQRVRERRARIRSAQRMPSLSASALNAASASASVAPTYSARPLSLRCACSGPTAG